MRCNLCRTVFPDGDMKELSIARNDCCKGLYAFKLKQSLDQGLFAKRLSDMEMRRRVTINLSACLSTDPD